MVTKYIYSFKERNPDFYEFILFNIMSNVATITNFLMLWIGNTLLFNSLADRPFHAFIFNYPVDVGGLGGFVSFLVAYVIAQIVNFIVQRKVVFGATVSVKKVLPLYVLTVLVAGIISVWLPPYVIRLIQPVVGSWSAVLANLVNILVQVAINYPMMKYKIMKKS